MSAIPAAPRSPLTLVLLSSAGFALVLVQVTLVNLLPTPWAVPDLVVVGVLAVALTQGSRTGAVVGAAAGLILDLIPPAAGPLGGWMLVLALAGALLGRAAGTYRPGPVAAMATLAVGSGAVVLARAAVVWFAGGTSEVAWSTLLLTTVASVGWGLLLAPLALLLSTRSTRAAEPSRAHPGVRPDAGRGRRARA